ncbi:MAG: trypsin-like peptidase domain-containing protein [Acidobacteriota bacterium]|nr:trypsin-like peptidase domain-containing protein [Acidobacteriota bacterium]
MLGDLPSLPSLAAHLRRSSVEVSGPWRGGGSGVIWNSDGLIMTNAHVVRGPRAHVTLSDGRTFQAEVVCRDARRDLAALRIKIRGLPAADPGDSSRLRVGQMVAALGNPFGVTGALSVGIIHATDEAKWIQADVRLAPGNSGGMLADVCGRVIGINTMIAGGIGVAVPSNAVESFLSGHAGAAAA